MVRRASAGPLETALSCPVLPSAALTLALSQAAVLSALHYGHRRRSIQVPVITGLQGALVDLRCTAMPLVQQDSGRAVLTRIVKR